MTPKRILTGLLFWGGGLLLLALLWPCLIQFLLAYLTASAVEPAVAFLSRRIPRPLAAALVLTALLAAIALGAWLLFSRLFYEGTALLLRLPQLLSQFSSQWLEGRLYSFLVALPPQAREWLISALEQAVENGLGLPDRVSAFLADSAAALARALPQLFLAVSTTLLAMFYCSAGLPGIRRYLRELIPPERRETADRFLGRLREALLSWCRVQGRLMVVVFAVMAAGLLLLRVPYALLAAGLGALVDALPFFGSGVLLVPWAALSFLRGDKMLGFGLLVLYALLCLLRGVLEPRFYGRQAGVSPLLTLLAMYGGFRLLGVWGLLLVPMALSVGAALLRDR